MVAPGAENPRTITTGSVVAYPSTGSTISSPIAGIVGAGDVGAFVRLAGVGLGLGVGARVGVGLGVEVGVGLGVGVGVGLGVGEGLGVGLGVGEGVASGLNIGSRLAVGSALPGPTAMPVATELEMGTGALELPLRAPDMSSRTTTASTPTATNANQSSRALERRGRVGVPRETTPVRRSPSADRGSLVMGWAGYSRIRKQALNRPCSQELQ